MYLTLDLSSKCTGWAKFTDDGKLKKSGRIIPSKEIANFFKIRFITDKIRSLFENVNELIIEDVYLGKNFSSIAYLLRLSGAVIDKWVEYKFKDPTLYKATTARKLAGVNGHSHKAEIQCFVLETYKFCKTSIIKKYKEQIEILKLQFKNKKIERGQYKYRMDKISLLIDKETGYGEDNSDAIILGLAYKNK